MSNERLATHGTSRGGSVNEIWTIVHRERDALIRDLEALNPQEWTTPSLCPGWDVHSVLAHLVNDAKSTRLGFVGRMIAAGFNFDRINALGIARERSTDPAQTLATFQEVCSRTTSAPAPLATRLVEIIVHGEDIRRPLGIEHQYPVAEVATGTAPSSVDSGG
ncbi:maleylpyruvate isomerase family mycothiol-dependent enzyme [Cryobacterium sp. N19]|uniref:maleylpyruvate isomerase family mycothiol-dependent enzyme n=1 Tax=Cryobacterium sp. N19 TaxID=2048288 RepID=UPI0035154F91